MYIFITVLLVVMIGAYGAGFAFGCRLPELDEERHREKKDR